MKTVKSFGAVLLLILFTLLFGSANQSVAGPSQSYSRGANGVLRLKHSVTLGINIPINVWIDGMQAGSFARGHIFERSLAPGRHTLYASRPGQEYCSFYGGMDVRPGETYSFVVKSTPNQIYLVPVGYVN
ncbi:MAG TPA: hypothetical protein VH252_01530 [Chthoniobacterales bacterium]|nr:hypothetical protein [Chthoniobacterales bacterium]